MLGRPARSVARVGSPRSGRPARRRRRRCTRRRRATTSAPRPGSPPVGQAATQAALAVAAGRVELREAPRGRRADRAARPGSGSWPARGGAGGGCGRRRRRASSAVRAGVAELEALVDEREVGHEVAGHRRGDDRPVGERGRAQAQPVDRPAGARPEPDPRGAARALGRPRAAESPTTGTPASVAAIGPAGQAAERPRAASRSDSCASCARTWNRAATSPAEAPVTTRRRARRTRRTGGRDAGRGRARSRARRPRARRAPRPCRAVDDARSVQPRHHPLRADQRADRRRELRADRVEGRGQRRQAARRRGRSRARPGRRSPVR